MARDSSGTYTAPTNSFNPAVEGATIDETDWNATLDDLEAGLTDSLSVSGKGKITAHIDFDEVTVATPSANIGRLYVKDVGGVTSMFFKDAAGTDTNLLLSAPGLAYTFSTSTTTAADPGSGIIRFNNASIALVTEIAIDDLDANGADISAFVLTWDDNSGSDRGKLIIQNRTAPTNVAIFRIGAASTDNAGWTQLSVTYITHAGSFGSNAPLGVTFSPSGTTGLDGVSAGLLYQYSSTTTTSADPGAGFLRLNNATLSSVTEIGIDDLSANSGNPDVSTFVLSWDDSTNTALRGTLIIKKATALQNYVVYSITGASTDNVGWTQLAVTYVTHAGSFTNNDSIGVEFSRTGNLGATGAPGTNGTNGTNGTTGATGAPGTNGTDPGIRWLFDSTTTMGADPGSGDLRLNNAAFASVTAISLSDLASETGAPDVSTFVLAWDDSTTTALRGTIIIRKISAPQNFAIYNVTGTSTDSVGWTELAVTHVQSAGSFTNADPLSVQFTRTGNAGAGTGDVVGPAAATANAIARYDGTTGKLVKDSVVTIANTTGVIAGGKFANAAGIPVLDSNASHVLGITTSSDLTADRLLTLVPGDAARTVTISGNATISQDYSSTGSPTFADPVVTSITTANTGLHILDTNASHDLIIAPGSDLTADRTLTITTGDAARTLTISASATVSQDYSTAGSPQFTGIELSHASANTLTGLNGDAVMEGSILKKVGKETIFIPAAAMIPRTTNGAASGTAEIATNRNMVRTLDFDGATQEFAQFSVWFPKSWNLGTVTFQPSVSQLTTAAGAVVFGLAGVAVSDGDTLDVAFGTAQTSTKTVGTLNLEYQGPESAAITIAGIPVAGDRVVFQLNRTVADAGDTLVQDARLHGIRLFFTTNVSTDI